MKCIGCRSDYVNLDETWSKKGSLVKGNSFPYGQGSLYEEFVAEHYCTSCLSNNSRNAFAWTPFANVSPHNNQIWGQIVIKDVPSRYPKCKESKENYYKTGMVSKKMPGEYVYINNTWAKQNLYASG